MEFDNNKYLNYKAWFMRKFAEVIAQAENDGSPEFFDAVVNALEDTLAEFEK